MTSVAGTAAKRPGLVRQLSRFGVSSGVAGIVDYTSVLVLVALGAWPSPARALGFAGGSTTAYLLNRRWTFEARRDTREVGAVAAVYGLSFLIVMVVNAWVLRGLPTEWWSVTLAWLLSQGLGTTFSFTAQRFLVFRR